MKNILHRIITGLSHCGLNKPAIITSNNGLIFKYIVKYSGDVRPSDPLPMLIALHGDGDTANNFFETALNHFNTPARIILFEGPISHEMGQVWPYSAKQFADYGKAFSEVVDQLAIKFPTVNKPVLLGFSGGGTMAYYQAVKHGDCYTYIFPVSGLLLDDQLNGKPSRPGAIVYAYHGKTDNVVPFSAGKKAIKLLKKNRVNVTFTEFESGHHGLFNDMKSQITLAIEEKLMNL